MLRGRVVLSIDEGVRASDLTDTLKKPVTLYLFVLDSSLKFSRVVTPNRIERRDSLGRCHRTLVRDRSDHLILCVYRVTGGNGIGCRWVDRWCPGGLTGHRLVSRHFLDSVLVIVLKGRLGSGLTTGCLNTRFYLPTTKSGDSKPH